MSHDPEHRNPLGVSLSRLGSWWVIFWSTVAGVLAIVQLFQTGRL